MTPYYQDEWLTVFHGDCRAVMAEMEPESVHCVVTSPPYWGLRDYGTATWKGGDPGCDHKGAKKKTRYDYALDSSPIQQASRTGTDAQVGAFLPECPDCGATRIDAQLGLEPTPDCGRRGKFRLRADLTDAQREFVVRRLLDAGHPDV